MWTDVTAIAVIIGFGEAEIGGVCCAKYLQGFEEGEERYLEVRDVRGGSFGVTWVVFVGFGGWEGAVECSEEGFVEENDA
jgi:hypothetical protein